VSALGLYYAYLATGDSGYFVAMKDAADFMVASGTAAPRTASDMIFLVLFNDLPGVTGTAYKTAAKDKFDWRVVNQEGPQRA
jgi:rhamnogalacturonyl hydrolase YesR